MLTILEKADLLQGMEIFCHVRTQSLARVAAIAQEISLDAQQKLFAENEAADAMFIILEGQVTIERGRSENVKLEKSQAAGALAMLADQPHTGTAIATQPAHVL